MIKNVAKKSSSIIAHFFQKKIMQQRNTTLSVNPKARIITILKNEIKSQCHWVTDGYD